MPNYPSSFVGGAAPGERSVDNVALRYEPKDLTTTNGEWVKTNMTELVADLNTQLTALDTEITAFQNILNPYTAARVATTANLTANYANGSSGVGATLTATGNGALTIDGVALSTNDRVLVKNQTTAEHNGLYVVTVAGNASTAWVLTRATDFDQAAELIVGKIVNVTAGTANGGKAWSFSQTAAVTFGTTTITFAAFSNTSGDTSANARLAYISAALGLKFNNLQSVLLNAAFAVKELSADVLSVNQNGLPVSVKYPSDRNRGF